MLMYAKKGPRICVCYFWVQIIGLNAEDRRRQLRSAVFTYSTPPRSVNDTNAFHMNKKVKSCALYGFA